MIKIYTEIGEIIKDDHGFWFTDEFSDLIFGPYKDEDRATVAQLDYSEYLRMLIAK